MTEVTITVDTDDIETAIRILNLMEESDDDPFEKWKEGWLLYGIVNEQAGEYEEKLEEIHRIMVETSGLPFNDPDNRTEKYEVQDALEDLEEKGIVESERRGDNQVWSLTGND